MGRIAVTQITDPGCPFAYSGEGFVTGLRWRYGDQLDFDIRLIGLAEDPSVYEARGYTPAWMAQGWLRFRRYGMPFTVMPRTRIIATGRACRAVVAARLESQALARRVLRALHFGWFTTTLLLDEDDALLAVLEHVQGVDAPELIARLDDDDVEEAYQRDRDLARSAAGTPAELQGKTASTDDGRERFTAQTLIFEAADGSRLIAGGHQSPEVYDVLVANIDPTLERRPPAESALEAVSAFDHPLTTREVALIMAGHNEDPDDAKAAEELIGLAADGEVGCVPMGDSALWVPRSAGPFERLRDIRTLVASGA